MKRFRRAGMKLLVLLSMLLSCSPPLSAAPWAGREDFANDAFERQWVRTDDPAVRSGRTWYWGPSPWFDSYEFYRESPNGLR